MPDQDCPNPAPYIPTREQIDADKQEIRSHWKPSVERQRNCYKSPPVEIVEVSIAGGDLPPIMEEL